MNFILAKLSYVECSTRKERSGIVWLLAGLWKLKRVRRNTEKGKCPFCLGEEDVTYTLLHCKLEFVERNFKYKMVKYE